MTFQRNIGQFSPVLLLFCESVYAEGRDNLATVSLCLARVSAYICILMLSIQKDKLRLERLYPFMLAVVYETANTTIIFQN